MVDITAIISPFFFSYFLYLSLLFTKSPMEEHKYIQPQPVAYLQQQYQTPKPQYAYPPQQPVQAYGYPQQPVPMGYPVEGVPPPGSQMNTTIVVQQQQSATSTVLILFLLG